MSQTPTELCRHFGDCGGCAHQDQPYPVQLAAKEAALRELLADFWQGPIPVTPSPRLWYYRNKVELKFDRQQYPTPPPPDFPRETVLGFKRQGRWFWTLDLDECRLFSPELPALLANVRAWYRQGGLPYFDQRVGKGLLKYLVLREGKRSGERLVILLTAQADGFDRTAFRAAVLDAWPGARVLWGHAPGKGDVATATSLEALAGDPWFHEDLAIPDPAGERRFRCRISPFGFFQVNPWATEQLYGHLRAWVKETRPATLYDLYGGSGGIAMSCADLVERVVSVDSFLPGASDGEFNVRLNGIANISFEPNTVEAWLGQRKVGAPFEREATAILDPPRAGLHPNALRRIGELAPRELIYISCKPSVFAKELPELLPHFELRELRAVDLFPHTPHVELLARFARREVPCAPPPPIPS